MTQMRLEPTSLIKLIEAVPNEVGDILDAIGNDHPNAKKSIPIVLNTLKALTGELYAYLPEGERTSILASCGTWLDIGLIIGWAPEKLHELLLKHNAIVVEVDDQVDEKGTAHQDKSTGAPEAEDSPEKP